MKIYNKLPGELHLLTQHRLVPMPLKVESGEFWHKRYDTKKSTPDTSERACRAGRGGQKKDKDLFFYFFL